MSVSLKTKYGDERKASSIHYIYGCVSKKMFVINCTGILQKEWWILGKSERQVGEWLDKNYGQGSR